MPQKLFVYAVLATVIQFIPADLLSFLFWWLFPFYWYNQSYRSHLVDIWNGDKYYKYQHNIIQPLIIFPLSRVLVVHIIINIWFGSCRGERAWQTFTGMKSTMHLSHPHGRYTPTEWRKKGWWEGNLNKKPSLALQTRWWDRNPYQRTQTAPRCAHHTLRPKHPCLPRTCTNVLLSLRSHSHFDIA